MSFRPVQHRHRGGSDHCFCDAARPIAARALSTYVPGTRWLQTHISGLFCTFPSPACFHAASLSFARITAAIAKPAVPDICKLQHTRADVRSVVQLSLSLLSPRTAIARRIQQDIVVTAHFVSFWFLDDFTLAITSGGMTHPGHIAQRHRSDLYNDDPAHVAKMFVRSGGKTT